MEELEIKSSNNLGINVQGAKHHNVCINFPNSEGYLELDWAKTRMDIYKKPNWFVRLMLRICFGAKYHSSKKV